MTALAASRQQYEEPLFRSTQSALLFAFNHAHGQVKPSALAAMVGKPKPPGKGLGGLDGSAQAGMIKAEIDALGPLQKWIITARFAATSIPCACRRPCCRGTISAPEWTEAIDWLTGHVLQALSGNLSRYHLRRASVESYFGVKTNFIRVSEQMRMSRDDVSVQNKKVSDYLKENEPLAMYAIDGRLRAAGIVG